MGKISIYIKILLVVGTFAVIRIKNEEKYRIIEKNNIYEMVDYNEKIFDKKYRFLKKDEKIQLKKSENLSKNTFKSKEKKDRIKFFIKKVFFWF